LAHIDAAYRKKFEQQYPWSNLARKNLWNLARVFSSWEVMALWDLYLASDSWWAVQTSWSVYGMIRDVGYLIDDSRFKRIATKHEDQLIEAHYGKHTMPKELYDSLFQYSACKLQNGDIR
jgi:hypothetical protein